MSFIFSDATKFDAANTCYHETRTSVWMVDGIDVDQGGPDLYSCDQTPICGLPSSFLTTTTTTTMMMESTISPWPE